MTVRYAWPTFRHPWDLQVSCLHLDGESRTDLLDDTHRRLDLTDLDDWARCEIIVTASTSETLSLPLAGVHTLVEAATTSLRRPVPLEPGGDGYVGRVILDRADVSGAVHVRALVTARVDDRVRTVGSSDGWTVAVDRSAAPLPPGAPPFKTVWVDFTSADAPLLAQQTPTAHAHMDIAHEPVLYLNSAIEGFGSLLTADHAKTERRRARDLMGSQVARLSLTTLFRAASDEVLRSVDDTDEGPPAAPASALHRQTCEAVASTMPSVSSIADLYDRLLSAHRGAATDRITLWAEIDLAIDTLTQVSDTVSTVSKELRHA